MDGSARRDRRLLASCRGSQAKPELLTVRASRRATMATSWRIDSRSTRHRRASSPCHVLATRPSDPLFDFARPAHRSHLQRRRGSSHWPATIRTASRLQGDPRGHGRHDKPSRHNQGGKPQGVRRHGEKAYDFVRRAPCIASCWPGPVSLPTCSCGSARPWAAWRIQRLRKSDPQAASVASDLAGMSGLGGLVWYTARAIVLNN